MERFGLSPSGLERRIRNRREPRVLCNSLPKAGTHLLERALCLHPRLYRPLLPTINEMNIDDRGGLARLLGRLRPGGVLVSHLACRPEWAAAVQEAGVRALLMVRDPRDVVVSTAHFVVAEPSHPWHARYLAEPDVGARIRLTIAGDAQVVPIGRLLAGYGDWEREGALVVRFEDLVGAAGGGDDTSQRRCLRDVYDHLGLPLDEARLEEIAGRLFSASSPTFRRGAIGQWRHAFDDEARALFDGRASELLGALGYA